jgi:hypothetical protein
MNDRLTLPAGKYFLGDPCYVLDGNDRSEWQNVCNQLWNGTGETGDITLLSGRKAVMFRTLYGDGGYLDQFGKVYSVDAGLIGLSPMEDVLERYAEDHLEQLGKFVEFSEPVECWADGPDFAVLHFGTYSIDTDPAEEPEED